MFSLSSIISFAIYLLIGVAVVIFIVAIFRKLGRQEQAASPAAQWEKAVEAYGDEAIVKLYRNARSDQERAEIASFISSELTRKAEAGEEVTVSMDDLMAKFDEDPMGVTAIIPDFQRIESACKFLLQGIRIYPFADLPGQYDAVDVRLRL